MSTMRLTLFAVYSGTLSTGNLPNDVRVKIGELNNRGAITLGSGKGSRVQLSDNCQWSFVSARRRPAEMPAGGHENCPVMANRSAHQDSVASAMFGNRLISSLV